MTCFSFVVASLGSCHNVAYSFNSNFVFYTYNFDTIQCFSTNKMCVPANTNLVQLTFSLIGSGWGLMTLAFSVIVGVMRSGRWMCGKRARGAISPLEMGSSDVNGSGNGNGRVRTQANAIAGAAAAAVSDDVGGSGALQVTTVADV